MNEAGLTKRRHAAGMVDECVLEDPKVPVATEWIHMLVVPPKHRPDACGEELVEGRNREIASASHIGTEVAAHGRPRTRRPRRRCHS